MSAVRNGSISVIEWTHADANARPPIGNPKSADGLAQTVQFCRASDGTRLAVGSAGDGLALVKTANWLNHIEFDWESPLWSPFLKELASQHRLVRYDARGNGLSDWQVDDVSFEAFVRDLETVVDAMNLSRFSLLGMSQGAAVAIAYAVRHPERVDKLVLVGAYAQGRNRRGMPMDAENGRALLSLMRSGWVLKNSS